MPVHSRFSFPRLRAVFSAAVPSAAFLEEGLQEQEPVRPSLNVPDEGKADEAAAKLHGVTGEIPEPLLRRLAREQTGTDPGLGVRVHEDGNAASLARRHGARALATGNNVYLDPAHAPRGSAARNQLLAHEFTHVAQQKQAGTLQVQPDTLEMDPITIRTGRPQGQEHLSSAPDADEMTVSRGDDPRIEQGSVAENTPLPWNGSAWNGQEIAEKLGQYDRIAGTDSDAFRCVQTVALMSHILMGPSAVSGYLSSIGLQGMLAGDMNNPRVMASLRMIRYVNDRVRQRSATYGDFYWVIEAVHALFYTDRTGTPQEQIHDQVIPSLDLSATMTRMDVWCDTPAALLAEAAKLNPGEQLMLNTWGVAFNTTFDAVEGAAGRRSITVNITDDTGRVTRPNVRLTRIDATRRPGHDRINRDRDSVSGHQMLIYKDAATGHIMMYEPELAENGRHLFDLTNDSSMLQAMLFHDQPAFEMYAYVQVLGKITPFNFSAAFGS